MRVNSILETIGNTPIIKINNLFKEKNVEVWVKLERTNPGGSIKDRIALAMIEDAEKSGKLKPGGTIVEPTSGNTGVGLALVAAVKGYKVILVMPESMSIERRKLMAAYGAELVLTPREKGMKGAIEKAAELEAENEEYWQPNQFKNPANVKVHAETTAKEIIEDFPEGLDYFITGVGTGGHLTGVASELKKHFPNIKVLAVEPEGSQVIAGEGPGPHPIQGIGAGFIPAILDTELLEGTIAVNAEEAYVKARDVAKTDALFVGISSGASLAAIEKQITKIPEGSRILTFAYDTGERYLSVEGLFV